MLTSPSGKVITRMNAAELREMASIDTGDKSSTTSLVFSPSWRLLAFQTYGKNHGHYDHFVTVRNHITGQEHAVFRGHQGSISSIKFSPDETLLASCSWDNTIRLWNVKRRREAAILTGHKQH